MDKHTAIIAIPELDETTVKEARRIFYGYRDKHIISECSFDDDMWYLNNETAGFRFNFRIEPDRLKSFAERLCITEKEFMDYMKTYVICQMGELDLGSLRSFIHDAGKMICSDLDDPSSVAEGCNAYNVERFSEFLSIIPEADREEELADMLALFDEAEEYAQAGQTGDRRTLASFESYFRFGEILDRFWKESTDEDEKLFFFPVWMWWHISGVLPLRPCEFVVTPRDCLSEVNGRYTLSVRRNRKKGSGKTKSYRISSDFEISRYVIPESLAKEIKWYIDKTKDYPEELTHTLFVTETHYSMWERRAPYTSRFFSYINLKTCLRYFFNMIVSERYGYRVISRSESATLPDDNTIEYLCLGDTRHLSLINAIAEGVAPYVASMLAGHDNPEMTAHYYSNVIKYFECRTYRMFKKQIKGKQLYTLSVRKPKLPVKQSIKLANGGRCLSHATANGDYSDCYRVMGPGGELGFCMNCEFYADDSKTFSDSREMYVNSIENECRILEEVVKKVRLGKGDSEEIASVLLRLRDKEYSYQQYLIDKMEREDNGKKENL